MIIKPFVKKCLFGDISVVETSLCYLYCHLFHAMLVQFVWICIGIDSTVYCQLSMCACIIQKLSMRDGKLLMTNGEGGK